MTTLLCGLGFPVRAQPMAGEDASDCSAVDSLQLVLERHARGVGGSVGLAAIHIESGLRVSLNGDQRFPMASVYKIPIALQILRQVEGGVTRLTDTVAVSPEDHRPGHSPLAVGSPWRTARVTVDSLMRLMLTHSDNTATDLLLRLAGGPLAVTARLRQLGVAEMDVDRSEARTFADLWGIPDSVPESRLSRRQAFRLRDAVPLAERQAARERYGEDPRDTATPDATADLLALIVEGVGLRPESRDYLLTLLGETRTGPRRLRGLLPPETEVAHKTGTMGGAINDVGIVTLPDGSRLAVAVFVNSLRTGTRQRERTIARLSRSLYDYFAGVPGTPLASASPCGGRPGASGAG